MGPLADLPLPLLLLGAQGLAQLGLVWLACCLRRRLRWPVQLSSLLLSWGMLAPFLDAQPLLVPTDVLAEQTPAIEESEITGRQSDLVDPVQQFLPWEVEVRRALSAGRLPLWSDRLDGGSSPWSNPQAQVLSPIAMLSRLLPLQHHLLAGVALKIQIAFQGTWLLATLLGLRGWPALLVGVSFAWGGGVIAWGLFPHSAAVVWLPWLAAALVRLVRRSHTGAHLAATTVTLALAVSGHPEVATGSVLLAAWIALRVRRERDRSGIARCAAAGLLGIAMAAPLLLPFALEVGQSQRARDQQLSLPSGNTETASSSWFRYRGERLFRAALHPNASGEPYSGRFQGAMSWPNSLCGYTGLTALLGASVALVGRRRRLAGLLLLPPVVAVTLASRFAPIEAALAWIPMAQLPEYSRWVLPGTLGLALAGGLGLQQLLRHGVDLHSGLALLSAGLLSTWAGGGFAAVAGATLGLALLGLVVRRWLQHWAGLVWLLGALLDLGVWARPQLPSGNPWVFYQRTAFLEELVARAAQEGPWRVVGEGYLAYPSLLAVYGLEDPRTHNPLAPVARLRVLEAAFGFAPTNVAYHAPFRNVEHPLLDFLGVRYVISNNYAPAKHRLREVARFLERGARLYQNDRALPRYFFPCRVEPVERSALPSWIAGLSDGAVVAVPSGSAIDESSEPVGHVPTFAPPVVLESRPGFVHLAFEPAERSRLLASSVPGPRGWRARDSAGRPVPTVPVNGAFLGVLVPPGSAAVVLRYRPPGLLAGLAVALLAAAILGWTQGSLRRRKAPWFRRSAHS